MKNSTIAGLFFLLCSLGSINVRAQQWTECGSGGNALQANGNFNAMITDSQGNLYVGGNFTGSDGKSYVAKWDGSTWASLGGAGLSAFNNNNCALSSSCG